MLTPLGRWRILKFVLGNPMAEVKVRELAKKLGLSPAHISRTLKVLRREGVIKNDKVDLSAPIVRALKIFLNTQELVERGVIDEIKSLGVAGAGIYGSWANGTNYEDSDLDIWVKVDEHPGEVKVASLASRVREDVGTNVQLLVLTPDKIKRLKRGDPTFYYSLLFGSIVILGETIE
jgi:predicted nucleotidyltransferase